MERKRSAPKESVFIMVRKIIGRGIVQYLELLGLVPLNPIV